MLLLTNTSGAVDAGEAVRLARLARAAGLPDWIKLEITPDPRYLLPDPVETLRAAEPLVREGFTVLPYCPADPVLCKHLEEAGCATVMPLGSWIGSNQGLRTRGALEIIVEQATVPVVVDAGLGAPSHAAEAMELGADAVLVNTAIGTAGDPGRMAGAFRLAVEAGPGRPAGGATGDRAGGGRFVAPDRVPVVSATPVDPRVPPRPGAGRDRRRRRDGHRRRRAARRRRHRPPTRTSTGPWRAPHPGLADFAALLSDAAAARLEDLAQAANQVTVARFGRTVRLFSPLYLSNLCVSTCTYCGFSAGNDIARRTLSVAEVEAEAAELHRRGFRHLLLVAGEHARIINRDYLVDCVRAVAPSFAQVGIEVQVWDTDTYRRLLAAGCDGVTVYQEAYDPGTYAAVHLKGKKRNYAWRLAAPDRAAAAGCAGWPSAPCSGCTRTGAPRPSPWPPTPRPWFADGGAATCRSPCPGCARPPAVTSRRIRSATPSFVQLLCALRIVLPDVGISLSTREPAPSRRPGPPGCDHHVGGSHTEPGGYAADSDAEPQFEISDTRSPAEVAAALRAAGYDPVWKDWQRA